MGYLDNKEPPKREDRLKACISFGGTVCGIAKKNRGCCMDDSDRSFSQGSICLLLPGLAMLNSLPDNVVLLHGAIGCGSCTHSQNANVRTGGSVRFGKVKDALWLSTALDEADVISGGELKLEEAIIEADERYSPKSITVVAACVPGIIGDDVDGVIDRVQPKVKARLIPVHCEGFKTKIWATAYDAVYHGIGRKLLQKTEDNNPQSIDEDKNKEKKTIVNLLNVSSMGRVDEVELTRLLNAIGIEVNVFPIFAKPEEMYKVTEASLSISTCPTHDDYFVKFLHEEFGVPYILKHMPIGIENTNSWLRDIGAFFGLEAKVEKLIQQESEELKKALEEYLPFFKGKTAFIGAGEFRALATAGLLQELGFEIVGVRSYHHDEFANGEYDKLIKASSKDFPINIANAQPFEEANLLKRLQPDIFLGHANCNGTAAKLGVPTHVIYNTGLNYIGYKGVYELARRLYRQLTNTAFNKNLSKNLRLPYTEEWYKSEPFKHIKVSGGEFDE